MDTYEPLYLTMGEDNDFRYILSETDLNNLDKDDSDDDIDPVEAYNGPDGVNNNQLLIEGISIK